MVAFSEEPKKKLAGTDDELHWADVYALAPVLGPTLDR